MRVHSHTIRNIRKNKLFLRSLDTQDDIICGLLPWWWVTCQCLRTARCTSHAARTAVMPAPTPTTPEEGVYCITSSKNKKRSVVLAAQMVRKAFKQTVWCCEKWPLNKKTSVLTLWVSDLPRSEFRMEILSVIKPSCQFLVKWVIDSGHSGLNHIKTDHVGPLWDWSHNLPAIWTIFLLTLL